MNRRVESVEGVTLCLQSKESNKTDGGGWECGIRGGVGESRAVKDREERGKGKIGG